MTGANISELPIFCSYVTLARTQLPRNRIRLREGSTRGVWHPSSGDYASHIDDWANSSGLRPPNSLGSCANMPCRRRNEKAPPKKDGAEFPLTLDRPKDGRAGIFELFAVAVNQIIPAPSQSEDRDFALADLTLLLTRRAAILLASYHCVDFTLARWKQRASDPAFLLAFLKTTLDVAARALCATEPFI